MKKLFCYSKAMLTSMAFLFLSLSFSAMAQKPTTAESSSTVRQLHTHSVGVGLGQVFLYGDHDDYGDSGLGVDLFYAYTASYSFDLLINAHYSSHSSGQEKTTLWGTTVNIKGRVLDFDAFSPYLLAGLGFYAPKNRRFVGGNLKDSSGKIGFGFSIGTGADLRLNNRVSMGLMLAYHSPFDISQDNDPEVSGSYLRVLLNAMYTF